MSTHINIGATKAISLALAGAATLVVAGTAQAQRKTYEGRWTVVQNVASRANDYHMRIDVLNPPAFVVPGYNIRPDRFTSTSTKIDGIDFTVNWEDPTADVMLGQSIDVGFRFETDRPWRVSSAWWTWNGVNIGSVSTGQFSWHVTSYAEAFNYQPEQPLPEQSEWRAWNDDPERANFFVTDQIALSPPYALEIDGADDAVLPIEPTGGGVWMFQTAVFIREDFQNEQSLILLNEYPAAYGPGWSTYLRMDGTDCVIWDHTTGAELPLIKGDWSLIQIEIDLVQDMQRVFYNEQLLVEQSWTAGLFEGGQPEIAAIDLWGHGNAQPLFYDDMQLVQLVPGPPICPADIDGNGAVDVFDLIQVLSDWGCTEDCDADVDGDGMVGVGDLLQVLSNWGPCE